MKRKDAIKIIKSAATKQGLDVRLNTKAGKGSHTKIYVGNRRTTMPLEVSRALLKKIMRQLELEE